MLDRRRWPRAQQFIDPMDRVIGQTFDAVAQVGLDVETIELRGAEQAVDRGGAFAAVAISGQRRIRSDADLGLTASLPAGRSSLTWMHRRP